MSRPCARPSLMPTRSRSEFPVGKAHRFTCASCGLVNLDRFLSFPFCAACGARLPENQTPRLLEKMRRPVPTLWWALTVGSGILTLATLAFGILLEKRGPDIGRLTVAAQIPHKAHFNQVFQVKLGAEPVENDKPASFKNLNLRLSETLKRDFEIVALTPAPQSRQTQGSGVYYFWPKLRVGQSLTMRLKPKKIGRFSIQFGVYAQNYEGFEVRRTVEVSH